MDKIYIVRSYFEDYECSRWQIIGLFTDKKIAYDTSKKWEDFYEEKKYNIFKEPKNWKPSEEDCVYDKDCTWEESIEYSNIFGKYNDIINFKEIEVDEFDLNKDISLNNSYVNSDIQNLMIQWDRNYKIKKLINES